MRRSAVAAPIAVALFTSACTSPAAVGRYAKSSTAITARVPLVVDGIGESCRLVESYRIRRTTNAWYDDASLRAACAARDSATRNVLNVNRVLGAYLAALAALADDKVTGFDSQIDALGKAVTSAGGFDKSQVSAIGALASFASSSATDGYRRSKLRTAIAAQNDNVRAVANALHEIVDRDFRQYLRDEERAQLDFYRATLAEHMDREPLAAVLVRDAFDQRAAALRAREDAVASLARALTSIAEGHQELYAHRNHLGRRELLATITARAKELESATAKIEKAF